MVLQVTNSPFNQEQADTLNRLLPTLSELQRIWLSGYLAADSKSGEAIAAAPPNHQPTTNAAVVSKEATVLYGSQTGNSQKLAESLAEQLQTQGFQVKLSSMLDFKTNTLKKIENLFVLISTHGEGDPPDNAISFHEFLQGRRAPKLEGMRFSVLALGDTSYEKFCQTGKDFDKRLEELGATRLVSRMDCDVDFDEDAEEWINKVISSLAEATVSPVSAGTDAASTVKPLNTDYSRRNPFPAEVFENMNLNGRGSERETRHLEISLEGSGLQYEPGDSVGIYPRNHPRLVEELLAAMKWKPEELVPINKNGDECPLGEALTSRCEITTLTKPLLEKAAQLTSGNKLGELLKAGRETELRDYMKGRDLLDVVRDYDLQNVPAQDFVPLLRKMPARLYSISSSPQSYPDEVHLTIRKVSYESYGRKRYGVCSSYVSDRIKEGDKLDLYVQPNPNFKLPSNPDSPVIMIGPGTGVAPYRAFLGEREETGAQGKTWLFYGDQHFYTDFLYQIDWQRWLKDGVLTRMDVAFSRDTDEKVYVQHRMLEKGKELYQWLQEGASVYVCGDEKKMAHDVHAALTTILKQEGGLSTQGAAAYLEQMKQDKRYQRDVY